MKKIIFPILFLLCLMTNGLIAQEFNFTVSVNTSQVSGTDKRIFESLQEAVNNFMNTRTWTNIKFEQYERIEGSMVIVVKNKEANNITAELNMGLRRPVYKSTYNTPLFNYIDNDFNFTYIESQPLDFNENSYSSNLTSMLAFYAYFSLGLYFDTFGPNGGDDFFKAAEQVVTTAQSSTDAGWKAFDSYKNRYWLIESFTNTAYRPMRQFIYEYHRLGLDIMGNGKVDDGRNTITKSLENLKTVYKSKPSLYFLQILCDTKREEWKNVYSDGPLPDKTKAINILREIDPSHAEEYEAVLNAKPRF